MCFLSLYFFFGHPLISATLIFWLLSLISPLFILSLLMTHQPLTTCLNFKVFHRPVRFTESVSGLWIKIRHFSFGRRSRPASCRYSSLTGSGSGTTGCLRRGKSDNLEHWDSASIILCFSLFVLKLQRLTCLFLSDFLTFCSTRLLFHHLRRFHRWRLAPSQAKWQLFRMSDRHWGRHLVMRRKLV